MSEKSIKNIRKEFKANGVFYTPPELAETLLKYIDIEYKTAYDPTCGSGSLLSVLDDSVLKYGQELDEKELEKAKERLTNFDGRVGDTLKDDKFKDMKFDLILGNPPFSVKWNPDEVSKEDERFNECGILPPASKADWAFMLHILSHLDDNGVAIVLEFPGILYRGNKEGKIRQWFVENNYIERVVHVPGNTFEDTTIATCILVLRKNKKTTDIIFENREDEITKTVKYDEIEKNDFNLSVNYYAQKEVEKEEINIDDVNKQLADILINKVRVYIEQNRILETLLPDNFYIDYVENEILKIIEKDKNRNRNE